MALSGDIANLPASPASGATSHLANHAVIHAALKSHEARANATDTNLAKKADLIGGRVDPAQLIGTGSSGSGIRVDTSVGTRVFVGGVMIHGDTGYRSITLEQSFIVDEASLRCTVRRVGDLVEIETRVNPSEDLVGENRRGRSALLEVPSGFRPRRASGSSFASGTVWPLSGAVASEGLGTVAFTVSQLDIAMPNTTSGTWVESDALLVYASWLTRDSWPTSLPGTPY